MRDMFSVLIWWCFCWCIDRLKGQSYSVQALLLGFTGELERGWCLLKLHPRSRTCCFWPHSIHPSESHGQAQHQWLSSSWGNCKATWQRARVYIINTGSARSIRNNDPLCRGELFSPTLYATSCSGNHSL